MKGPAFYATSGGGWRDWWVVLHPPYTAWHLSYVVIGACVAPNVRLTTLLATLLAFFLAVGVAAHTFDELNGRPLGTGIPAGVLVMVGLAGLAGAVGFGIAGVSRVGPWLVPFIAVGTFLVLAYDLELMGGRFHTDVGFAAAWGAFPVLTSYFAQAGDLALPAGAMAVGALGLSWAQRVLSTPARTLRRRAVDAGGTVTLADGTSFALDRQILLAPLERALKSLSWSTVALAVGLALYRLAG